MAYNINLTSGNLLTTIPDGTVNSTATPLTLIGKNYANYGQFLDTNFVKLLENFNNITEPTNALEGQIWWDSGGAGGNLKVLSGTDWRTIASVSSSSSQPEYAVTGAGWWDTVNSQLSIYDGSAWILVGPAFTSTGGNITPQTITDSSAVSHNVLSIYIGDQLISTISKDAAFSPNPPIAGFDQIKRGFNLSTTYDYKFVGNATNAEKLGNIAATNYARNDQDSTFLGVVVVNNANGLKVGTANNFIISQSGTTSILYNNVIDADTKIRANVGGAPFDAIIINGAYGSTTIANLQTSGAFETTGYIRTIQGSEATSNATGAIRVVGGIGLTGNIFTSNSIQANGNIRALGNITTASIVQASGGLQSTPIGNATASSAAFTTVSATGAISGVSVAVTGAFTGATLTTTGNTASGNVNATANVVATDAAFAARYLYANGAPILSNWLPPGVIVLWSGSIASIPVGWALCNGSNGTPDLRNLFVVGAGSTYAVGASGGSADAITVSHSHTATTADPGNFITGSVDSLTQGGGGSVFTNPTGVFNLSGSTPAAALSYNPGGLQPTLNILAGSHTHSVTVNATGSSGTNANLPPYYALAYIMKL